MRRMREGSSACGRSPDQEAHVQKVMVHHGEGPAVGLVVIMDREQVGMAQLRHLHDLTEEHLAQGVLPEQADQQGIGLEPLQRRRAADRRQFDQIDAAHAAAAEEAADDVTSDPFHRQSLRACSGGNPRARILAAAAGAS